MNRQIINGKNIMSGFLIYANTASSAVKLSYTLDCACVIREGQARQGEAALARGETVVATFESFNSDIRIPRGCKVLFDPECPSTGPERARAEVRGMVLDAISPTLDEKSRIFSLLEKFRNVFPEGFDPFTNEPVREAQLEL